MFDKLLLLCDGKMAYFGEVKNCAQHFASLELPCPANYNLADHICKYHKADCQLGYSEVLLLVMYSCYGSSRSVGVGAFAS